jgi:hypothetical protein
MGGARSSRILGEINENFEKESVSDIVTNTDVVSKK